MMHYSTSEGAHEPPLNAVIEEIHDHSGVEQEGGEERIAPQ